MENGKKTIKLDRQVDQKKKYNFNNKERGSWKTWHFRQARQIQFYRSHTMAH